APVLRPLDGAELRLRHLLALRLLHPARAGRRRRPRREPAVRHGLRPLAADRQAAPGSPRRRRLGGPPASRRREERGGARSVLAGAARGQPASRWQAALAAPRPALRPAAAPTAARYALRLASLRALGPPGRVAMTATPGLEELYRELDARLAERAAQYPRRAGPLWSELQRLLEAVTERLWERPADTEAPPDGLEELTDRPVFVLGYYKSGTTL